MKKSSSSGSLAALGQQPGQAHVHSPVHHPQLSRLARSNGAIPRAASHSNLAHACCGHDCGHHHGPQAFAVPRPRTENGAAFGSGHLGRGALPPLSALGHQHGATSVRFATSSSGAGILAAAAQEQAATQVCGTTSGAQGGHLSSAAAAGGSEAALLGGDGGLHQRSCAALKQQQQKHSEAAAPGAPSATAAASTGSKGGAPFASLTRVFLIGSQPSNLVRQLAGRKWRVAGPVSLLLFLFGMLLAILTAVRTVLVRRVRACKCCKGYGIVRCRLCNGEGTVAWMGECSAVCGGEKRGTHYGRVATSSTQSAPCGTCVHPTLRRQEQPPGDVPAVHDQALCDVPRLRRLPPQEDVHAHPGHAQPRPGARVLGRSVRHWLTLSRSSCRSSTA